MHSGRLFELLRFGLSGALTSAVGLSAIYVFKIAGVGDGKANALGYAIGWCVGLLLHKTWTFRSNNTWSAAALRFLAVTACAYVANLFIVLAVIKHTELNPYVAQAIGIPAYAAVNYLGCRYFVFVRQSDPNVEV